MQEWRRGRHSHAAPDQSAPRAAPSLSAPIDFYYKNFARGFFLFPAHRKPGDAHNGIRIIRLYELTNAIDFYNEAFLPASEHRRSLYLFIRFEAFVTRVMENLSVLMYFWCLSEGDFLFR